MEYSSLPLTPLEKMEKLEQLRILENGFPIKVVETDFDSIGVDSEADIKIIEKQLAALSPENWLLEERKCIKRKMVKK